MSELSLVRAAYVPHADPVRTGADLVAAAAALRTQIAAQASARDAERRLPHAELAAVKAAGLLTARIPVSHGGPGASWAETARIVLELSRGDPNVGQAIQPHSIIMDIIRTDASESQKRFLYDLVLSGGMITNAIAERGGAFYGDIATRLVQTESGLRLRGVKHYATGSLFAEHLFITALAENGAVAAAFIPGTRAGVSIHDDWNGMGQRTTASGTVQLDDVAVDPSEIFFPTPQQQLRWHHQAAAQLMHAAIDAGIALAALDDALVLCRSRGRPLRESGVERAGDDPYVLQTIGDLAVLAHGATAMVERAAAFVDIAATAHFSGRHEDRLFAEASIAVAEAKVAATQAALSVSEKLYLVANASGTDRALNLDRHWRNARTHTTHDPVSYKSKFIGDYLLNGRMPPSTAKV